MASIEDIKSTISKKGGLSVANRFQIFFTPPNLGLLNKNPSSLIGTLVSGGGIGNLINDPRDISLLCESVSIPGRTIQTLDFQAEKQQIKMPNGVIEEDITCSFILTNDYYIRTMFDDWHSAIFDVENYQVGYKKDFATDVVIQQLNQKNRPVYGVRLVNAFPNSISAIELNNSSENTMQKVSVTFNYDRYIPENAVSSVISAAGTVLDLIT